MTSSNHDAQAKGTARQSGAVPAPPDGAKGPDCRCEEASKMTPRQLLGLMLSDLAFWKKRRGEKD